MAAAVGIVPRIMMEQQEQLDSERRRRRHQEQLAMTVAPIGNLLAAFEEQIARNNEYDPLASPTTTTTAAAGGEKNNNAWAASMSRALASNRARHQAAKRQGLAASIRDKVKLFDEGQVTLVKKLSRELDYDPEHAEFDPAISRTVFERRASMGPGVPYLEFLQSASFDEACSEPTTTSTTRRRRTALSPPPSGPLSADEGMMAHVKQPSASSSRSTKKSRISRRASTGGAVPLPSSSSSGHEKSDNQAKKRKKKKKTTKERSLAASSSSQGDSLMGSPTITKRQRKTVKASSSSPTKSPAKSKAPKKLKKATNKDSSDSSPNAPPLGKQRHHRRRGRKRDKKHSKQRHQKKKSEKQQQEKPRWEVVVTHHNKSSKATFGKVHRTISMTLPETSKLTPQRRMARRASTGRLCQEQDPEASDLWEVKATHAVHVETPSKEHAEDNTNSSRHADDEAVLQETKSKARPAPRRRMVRRHSTGSVSTRSNESDDHLVDFWHAYETDDSHSSVCTVDSNGEPTRSPPHYKRKRAVHFDSNVTVWVFTKEDTPFACDLELPQSFVSSKANDSAPRPPVRRTGSMDMDSSRFSSRGDAAPLAPPRRRSSDSFGDMAADAQQIIDEFGMDDDDSVSSWPLLNKQSRQSQERQHKKHHKRRVRFAEQLEEVRFFERDIIPEVVLPQVGIVFCAAATGHSEDYAPKAPRRSSNSNNDAGLLASSVVNDDHAPRAPRRNNSDSDVLRSSITSISDSIEGLRESEDMVREERQVDLMPRFPRRESSRSVLSDDSTVSLHDTDYDDDTLEEPSEEEETENNEQHRIVSPLRPGFFRGDSLSQREEEAPSARGDSSGSKARIDRPNGQSLRPSTVRGDSFQSIKSNASSITNASSIMSKPPLQGRNLRPSAIRGDSFLCIASNLRPETVRGDSFQSIASNLRPETVRGDSFQSIASNLRPETVRGDQIQSVPSSLRPSTVRGDSFQSIASNESSIVSNTSSLGSYRASCPARSLRPGTIRGNSFTRMSSDISMGSSHSGASTPSLRPSGFRGDSFKISSAENGTEENVLERSEEAHEVPVGGLQQDIIWEGPIAEGETEDNTESLSEDIIPTKSSGIPQSELNHMFNIMTQQQALPTYAKRPGTVRGDSFLGVEEMQNATTDDETKGKRRLFKKIRRRRGVQGTQSNDESSSSPNRPNIFSKMGMKRDKLFRRTSDEV